MSAYHDYEIQKLNKTLSATKNFGPQQNVWEMATANQSSSSNIIDDSSNGGDRKKK